MSKVFIDVDKKNTQALESLKALSYVNADEIFGYYEVDADEIKQYPELAQLPQFTQKELEDKIIANSKSQITEIENRLYLDFVPPKLLKTICEQQSLYKYDTTRNQYFIEKDKAILPENIRIVRQCLRKREILATDFGGLIVTPGREALAQALNITSAADREEATAKALALCAKESAFGQKGAINNFSEILRAEKMVGRYIGFFKAFNQAKEFYTSVNKAKNIKMFGAVAKVINGDNATEKELEKVDDRVTAIFNDQAAKNIKLPLAKRLAYAMKAQTTETRLALAADVLSDYIQGHALQSSVAIAQKRMTYYHNEKPFLAQVKAALEGTNIADPEAYEKIMQMAKFVSDNCIKIDANTRSCCYTRKGMASPTNIPKLVEENCKLVKDVKDYFKISNYFKPAPEHTKAKLHELSGQEDPLYIVATHDQRKELQAKYADKISVDANGFLCVKDTPENRVEFAAYIPVEKPLNFSKSVDEMRAKALNALKEHGFSITDATLNTSGQWCNDKINKSLSYVINMTDGVPRMQIMDRNGSLNEKIMLGELTAEEKKEIKKAYEEQKLSREVIVKQKQTEVAKDIRANIDKLSPATTEINENNYLVNKGLKVTDFGQNTCFIDKSGDFISKYSSEKKEKLENTLVFPVVNASGKVMSFQSILPDGTKRFARGASLTSNFVAIGGYESLKSAKTVLVAEGVATAASIAKCVPQGTAVVACLSANNMLAVSKSLSDKFPEKALGIMADNDVKTAGVNRSNAGLISASLTVKALQDTRPNVAFFTAPLTKQELMKGNTDFNDSFKLDPARTMVRVQNAVATIEKAHELNMLAKQSMQKFNEVKQENTKSIHFSR